MSVVIDKLPHPYKLIQQITKKWKWGFFFFFFGKGFPRERERREKKVSKFFRIFLLYFLLSFLPKISLFLTPKKKKRVGIYRRNEENRG